MSDLVRTTSEKANQFPARNLSLAGAFNRHSLLEAASFRHPPPALGATREDPMPKPHHSDANLAHWFGGFANNVARISGRPAAFILALAVVLAWAVTGPLFEFSDTWQLVINTGTTIITFLMVFIIQNSQYRDNLAIQTKLDELIRASKAANRFI